MTLDERFKRLEVELINEVPKLTRGRGTVMPTMFFPGMPKATPADLFVARPNAQKSYMVRFTHSSDDETALIYAEGAARYPGQNDNNTGNDENEQQAHGSSGDANTSRGTLRGGWAYTYGPDGALGMYGARLEQRGPFGDAVEPATRARTRGRAALRAVVAGLRCRPWARDGYTALVVATGSAYVVRGATGRADGLRRWIGPASSWTTRTRLLAHGEGQGMLPEECEVPDRDLWEALLGEVERYAEEGLQVKFWYTSSDVGLSAVTMKKAWHSCTESDCRDFHERPAAGA